MTRHRITGIRTLTHLLFSAITPSSYDNRMFPQSADSTNTADFQACSVSSCVSFGGGSVVFGSPCERPTGVRLAGQSPSVSRSFVQRIQRSDWRRHCLYTTDKGFWRLVQGRQVGARTTRHHLAAWLQDGPLRLIWTTAFGRRIPLPQTKVCLASRTDLVYVVAIDCSRLSRRLMLCVAAVNKP